MPYLASISIYPVKSLDAVSVQSARVLPSGALADDRRFAMVDPSGQYVNGKRNSRVHLLRSTYDSMTRNLKIFFGAGAHAKIFDVDTQRPELEEWLEEFFGFQVSFRENTTAGFPDDTESPGPTLISTATLREVGGWFGLPIEQMRARFRANLEVDGVPPFWEDQLYGERGTTVRFRIGDVVFDGVNPCQRCVVPARDPVTGQDLGEFAKRFVEMRKKRLPKWAELSRFNHFYRLAVNTKLVPEPSSSFLSTGDPIRVIGVIHAPPEPATPAVSAARPTRWTGKLRVTKVVENTPAVRTFRFTSIENDALPFTYLPGQYLDLELPIEGTVHRRCYTISSSPTQKGYCEITVKREGNGTVSRYIHDHLVEGMKVHVSGPGGRFTFTGEEADAIVLIGAGVGITPLMSVIRYLTDRKWTGPIELIQCARSEREIIFGQELKCLSAKFPNLRVTTTLTQEPGIQWTGLRGRIDVDLLRRTLPSARNHRVHICGPIEMAKGVTQMLRDAGVSPDQIKAEAFGGPAPATLPNSGTAGNGTAVIGMATFTESGKSVPVHVDQTVLDAATCAGISIDRGCLAGICGRCRVRLVSGNVRTEVDEALSDEDRNSGFILSCQSRPLGNVAVEV